VTPAQLSEAAKCYCFNDDVWKKVVAYLLNAGGSGPVDCPQDMQVAWTPTDVVLGEQFQFRSGVGMTATTLTFTAATSKGGYVIENAPNLTTVSFPNLVSEDPAGAFSGKFNIDANPVLTSLTAPLLQTANSFDVDGNIALPTLSLPSLVTVNGGFFAFGCTLLSSVSLPVYVPTNGDDQNFNACALTAASVNHILRRCVLNAGYVSGTVTLDGGTNAAPTGQGVADVVTLTGRGVTVVTN